MRRFGSGRRRPSWWASTHGGWSPTSSSPPARMAGALSSTASAACSPGETLPGCERNEKGRRYITESPALAQGQERYSTIAHCCSSATPCGGVVSVPANDDYLHPLKHGPYRPPPLKKGDRAHCLLRGCEV